MTVEGKKKIAVVTGSSKGIGKAIVIAFANSKQYSGIITNGRNIDELQRVSDEIKSSGCDSIAIEADVSKENDCIRLIKDTIKHYDRIDVLVNNSGNSARYTICKNSNRRLVQNNIC
jgi:NAD(P)-dependent dehydrogenase (short-subunit alcohol dehydrogenase family)